MTTVVIDCSAVVDLLYCREPKEWHTPLARHDLLAPELIVPEIVSVARRLSRRERESPRQIERMLTNFLIVDIEYFAQESLMRPAWGLRDKLSAYDAMYVALASKLGIPLVTSDKRLARAAAGECEVLDLDGLLQG
ncbi:MAG: type II toxin-antitoxin system VapC family toxin [Leifsonia sp.]